MEPATFWYVVQCLNELRHRDITHVPEDGDIHRYQVLISNLAIHNCQMPYLPDMTIPRLEPSFLTSSTAVTPSSSSAENGENKFKIELRSDAIMRLVMYLLGWDVYSFGF